MQHGLVGSVRDPVLKSCDRRVVVGMVLRMVTMTITENVPPSI
jgi:hypothetical protein